MTAVIATMAVRRDSRCMSTSHISRPDLERKISELHREGFPLGYIAAWAGLPTTEIKELLVAADAPVRRDGPPRPRSLDRLFRRSVLPR